MKIVQVQGAEVVLAPPLLHIYVVEARGGVNTTSAPCRYKKNNLIKQRYGSLWYS